MPNALGPRVLRHFACQAGCGTLAVMNELRERLERLRSEVRGVLAANTATLGRDVDEKGEDTTPSQHPADVASDLYAREELVAEQLSLTRQLSRIDDALARLDHGTYGVCLTCGTAIPPERLEAVPETALCIDCQRSSDRGRPAPAARH